MTAYLDNGKNDFVVDLLGARVNEVSSIEAKHFRRSSLVARTDQAALSTGRIDAYDRLQ